MEIITILGNDPEEKEPQREYMWSVQRTRFAGEFTLEENFLRPSLTEDEVEIFEGKGYTVAQVLIKSIVG